MTEKIMTFNKRMIQLIGSGKADIRTNSLVNYVNVDTNSNLSRRSQMKIKDYGKMLCSLDYLDCVDHDLLDESKQSVLMKSFLQYLEPLSESSVLGVLEWMGKCKNVLRKARSTKWGGVFSILFAVYTKEAISEFKENNLSNLIDYSIRCAIESDNFILVLELLRTYLFDHDIQLQRIFEDMKGISPAIIDAILQTVRTLILRKFTNLQNNAIVLSFCRVCGEENRLVMIMSYKGNIKMKDRIPEKVLGFELVLYNFTQPSHEASSVFKSIPVSKKTPLPTVTESEARELFRKHSNLTMISALPYKSVGYSKERHRVVEKLCISLFCLHKGYIPYGEEIFPKQLGEFEVDVHEGYSVLGSGSSLEIGGYICRAGCGSIGGFVDLPNNKTGLITCAHVIFSSKELEKMESNGLPSGIEVKAFNKTTHSYTPCGTCTAAQFPKCFQQATPPQPNVDAALIELNPVLDTFRLRTVSSDQLYSAGFDPDNPPAFSGKVVHRKYRIGGRVSDKLDSVVKYGVQTGLTIGNLYHSGVHVRFIDHDLKLPDSSRRTIMCHQIEIQNFPQGQFFECGDSGSFVFCINPDKTLSCLGMAVGLSLPQNTCLVTPIDRILDSLDLSDDRLKYCSSNTSQGKLDEILTALKKAQTSLQTVERNVQRNFETIQSVKAEVRTLQSQFQQTENFKPQSSSNQSSTNQN